MEDNSTPIYSADTALKQRFGEISLPAWFAIKRNGGSIRLHLTHNGAYTTRSWEITFPEGTVFDGPTQHLRFKIMSYTLPDGHHVWSGHDHQHVYSEDDRDEARSKFHMSPMVVWDAFDYEGTKAGISHYVRKDRLQGYYDKPKQWFSLES